LEELLLCEESCQTCCSISKAARAFSLLAKLTELLLNSPIDFRAVAHLVKLAELLLFRKAGRAVVLFIKLAELFL
jgi:hypothetical protein